MSVRVRFAPNPSGPLHVGNLRTALFNWLFARHHDGDFILRIEDTDRSRVVPGALEAIFDSLRWLGLDWDEGPDPADPARDRGPYAPYIQSRRLELYQRAAERLIEASHAYRCYCSPERLEQVRREQQQRKQPPKYDRRCRDLSPGEGKELAAGGAPSVVRLKVPLNGRTEFHDLVRGDLVFENETLDDFVLLKSDGYPTYHLGNVLDDQLMAISHVLRGDELLSSTPRHVLLYQALGARPPAFAHLPMILGADRAKLSKRHGDTAVLEFQERGFLPEALFNFLALLGWSLDDHTEIISREQFIQHFDLDRVLANPAVFDFEKLTWMNGVYIRELPVEALAERVAPYLETALNHPVDRAYLLRVVPLIQERIKLLSEAVVMADFFFLEGELDYPPEMLLGKRFAAAPEEAAAAIDAVLAAVRSVTAWEHELLEGAVRPLAERLALKTGDLFGLVRVAVTGKTAAPPLFETMAVLGRERTLERLESARRRLG